MPWKAFIAILSSRAQTLRWYTLRNWSLRELRRESCKSILYDSQPRPSSLIESRRRNWHLSPKQDHLVCFFGGSLMLGATVAEAMVQPVSVPPKRKELTPNGIRDWVTGAALIKTCWDTHDTATYVLIFFKF